jgi:LacI family transcriptional regulator
LSEKTSSSRRKPLRPAAASAGRPHARPSTIKDVARAAGVSAGTVSRVTSNNPTVQPHVRAQVLAAIKRLGYRPNAIAQSMRTAETKLIGCLVADLSNPLYSAIFKSAEAVLAAAGYTLLIASTEDNIEREVQLVEAFARRRVDGLMGVMSTETDPRLLQALEEANIPLLLMEREIDLNADGIATDHIGGMRQATDHLIALGHRRIALITGPITTRSGRDRVAGYRAAHEAASLAIDETLLRCESLATTFAFTETQRLLSMAAPPTAIIAGGNLMLAGVLRALNLLGRAVPRDVSVLSSGETELAELAAPPVTVIRWDLAAFGREAASLMLSRLQNPDGEPRKMVIPCELILRKSCAPPAK